MKVVVLGNSGMAGHMVEKVLRKHGVEVHGFGRETLELVPRNLNDVGVRLSKFVGFDTDYVVNCMGAIKPAFQSCQDITLPIYTNAIFPHQLATWGSLVDVKVIHITTDCVYSGDRGSYVESDKHDALDDYGKSKSLGEPKNCMVLRTSIIGPEIEGKKRSLLEWIKAQKGKSANGFLNHQWNGITTLELAHCILTLTSDDLYKEDVFHVFSSPVSKCYMLSKISKAYGLDIEVNPVNAPEAVDRTLSSEKALNDLLCPLDFDNMIDELMEFEKYGRA